MVKVRLSDRQTNVLSFIIDHCRNNYWRSPSVRDIAQKTGISIGEVHRHLEILHKWGFISRGLHKARWIIPLRYPDGQPIDQLADAARLVTAAVRPAPLPDAHHRFIEEVASNYVDFYAARFPEEATVPVPVEQIAEHLFQLRVHPVPLREGISGQLILKAALINVHMGDKPVRRRFTTAHELGHCFLHARALRSGHLSCGRSTTAAERDADRFAACLLMPATAVLAALKEYRTSNPPQTLEQFVASRFDVSLSATRIRLREIERRSTLELSTGEP